MSESLSLKSTNNSSSLKERQCLYFLQGTELIGNVTIRKLHNYFGSYENTYLASEKELSSLLSAKMLSRFLNDKARKDIEYEYSRLARSDIHYYTDCDSEYPHRLFELHDYPPAILVNGELPNPSIPSIAIIGARNCSNYGRAMTEEYTSAIAKSGIQIISGMAMGIDGIAGRVALRSNGRSFAVLGCGPDVCYPSTNRDLFDSLRINGGIISEYTLGTPGAGWHFPMRNRIISALSDVLLVMEAKEKSGTMITVDFALELGREVYVLPGRNHDVMSTGCNQLIKQGAHILLSPEDFITDFLTSMVEKAEYQDYFSSLSDESTLHKDGPIFNSPEEQLIYNCLDYTPQPLDQIYRKVNAQIPITISGLMVTLTNLSVAGYVTSIGGSNYAWK